MLTGSIGLPPIVKKLGGLHLITMLNVIDVPPLLEKDAKELLKKLLNYQEVVFDDEAINHISKKLDWLIPFHVQLAAQELIDVLKQRKNRLILLPPIRLLNKYCTTVIAFILKFTGNDWLKIFQALSINLRMKS